MLTSMDTANDTPEAQARFKAARRKNRELRQLRETRRLEQTNQLLESIGGTDWTGSFYAMLDRFNQANAGFMGATNVNDRRYGRNWPIFQNEIDLQVARMPSRILTSTNPYAIGMLEGWTSYVGGEGFVRTVQDRPGGKVIPRPILAKLQAIIDEFAARNQWDGGEQPGLEEELIQRPEIDGEFGLCLHEDDAGLTWAETFEPEQLTQPPGSDMDYLFGILTEKGNPQRPLKYWLRGWNTDLHGDEYDASQIVHFKANVQRSTKRGFPTFSFGMSDTLALANDLRQALGLGGKIQASIAGVRQWDNASRADVQNFTGAFAEFTQTAPGGQTTPVSVAKPGGIEDVPKGMNWVDPPNSRNAGAHIQILHACLRAASVRYNAPDWMGSGDASANTYDNSVATGSTFGRRIIREQTRFKNVFHRIFWWALDTRCTRAGVITAVGQDGTVYRMAWEDIKREIELKITPASPEERNKKEEADRIVLLVDKKLMSPQQGMVELGEDVEETMAQIKAWERAFAPAPAAVPAVPAKAEPGPVAEGTLHESKDASGHEHAADAAALLGTVL